MNILLIWEEIPEQVKVYAIPTDQLTEQDYKDLRQAQGKYVNSVNCSENDTNNLMKINDYLAQLPDHCSYVPDDMKCRWKEYEIPIDEVFVGNVNAVFRCGFFL